MNTAARLVLVFTLTAAAMTLPAAFRDGPSRETLLVAVAAMVLAFSAWVVQCATTPYRLRTARRGS